MALTLESLGSGQMIFREC